MTNLTTEQLKQIIDGAPDGANGYNNNFGNYYSSNSGLNLNLLREILALREEVARFTYYMSAIRHKSNFQIVNNEGLQDVLRRIESLANEALKND